MDQPQPDQDPAEVAPEELRRALEALRRNPVSIPAELDQAIQRAARQRLVRNRRNSCPQDASLGKAESGRFWSLLAWATLGAAALFLLASPRNEPRQGRPDPGQTVAGRSHDLNQDGAVNIVDALHLARAVKSGTELSESWDLNGDGRIDGLDSVFLARTVVRLEAWSTARAADSRPGLAPFPLGPRWVWIAAGRRRRLKVRQDGILGETADVEGTVESGLGSSHSITGTTGRRARVFADARGMLGIGLLLAMILGWFGHSAGSAPATFGRFVAVTVILRTGEQGLAAYQLRFSASDPGVKVVGIEGGEAGPFQEPAFHDPAAIQRDRVILAAFSDADTADLPRGEVRVATIHLLVPDGVRGPWTVDLDAAADSEGSPVSAEILVNPPRIQP